MTVLLLGFRDMAAQWGRTLVLGVSLLLGVVGVVALSVTSSVAADMLIAQQEQLHGREASYTAALAAPRDGSAREETARFVQNIESRVLPQGAGVVVTALSAMRIAPQGVVRAPADRQPLDVVWASRSLDEVQRLPLVAGEGLSNEALPPGLLLNEVAARELGLAPGAAVLLSSERRFGLAVTIRGMVADGLEAPRAYGTLAAAQAFFPDELSTASLAVHVHAPVMRESEVAESVEASIRGTLLTAPEPPRRVDTVQSVRDQVQFFETAFGAISALVLFLAVLSATGVGIASVVERSREFVIRRALGATRRDVFVQMMSGAVVLGLVVSVLAVAAAVIAVGVVLPALLPAASSITPPAFPWMAIVWGVTAALGASILGALLPAVRATRLSVAAALRE